MTPDTTAFLRHDAEDRQKQQAEKAKAKLYEFGSGIHWPWQVLTDGLGPLQKGTVHVIAAPSGNGKSTLSVSLSLLWIEQGVTVVIGGFERSPEDQRRYFAAASLGLHPGRVLSGRWELDDDFRSQFRAMEERLDEMRSGLPPWDCLHFVDDDTVSVNAINGIGDIALAFAGKGQGSVCIVDHIDHGIRDSQMGWDVAHAMLNHAKAHGTRWVAFSQINNRELNKTGLSLARHRPMPVSAIKWGQTKEETAWTVSCLYQPLRPDATADEIKAVVEGRTELKSVVWENVTALALLKDRDMGAAGKKMLLGWDNGRIVDAPATVRVALEASAHGISTGRKW